MARRVGAWTSFPRGWDQGFRRKDASATPDAAAWRSDQFPANPRGGVSNGRDVGGVGRRSALEHGRARDERVGAGLRDKRGGLGSDAAVDLDADGAAGD